MSRKSLCYTTVLRPLFIWFESCQAPRTGYIWALEYKVQNFLLQQGHGPLTQK